MMRLLIVVLLLIMGITPPVRADVLVAVRSGGVMCASAEALARLTLPDGRSRSTLPNASAADLATMRAGGCVEVPYGARVAVQQSYRNTSIGSFDAGDGRGPREFILPNIIFRPLAVTGFTPGAGQRVTAPPPAPDTLDFFLTVLEQECPARAWRGVMGGAFHAPLENIVVARTRIEERALNAAVQARCAGTHGIGCITQATILFMLNNDGLPRLVRAYCARQPEGADDAEPDEVIR